MSNLVLTDLSLQSSSLKLEKRSNTISVNLQVQSSLDNLRYGTYQSQEHIIIPVVSQIGDSIVSAVNGPGPEFIPASVLSLYPEQRNGRPVVMGHPYDTTINDYVFANSSTEILESYSYGIWMNNYWDEENKRIKGELWLSKDKASNLPGELSTFALNVIERVLSGSTIEISEGNWVIAEQIDGAYNNQPYVGIWRLAITDHIATLKANERGACGVKSHGCGAGPYVMQGKLNNDYKLSVNDRFNNVTIGGRVMGNKYVANIRSFIRSLAPREDDKSTLRTEAYLMDIYSSLSSALSKLEPGFSYIDDIEVDNKLVIYAISVIEGDRYYTPADTTLYERSYTIDDNNKVTLGADRSEVVYVKSYVRVSEESKDNKDNKEVIEDTNNDNSNRSTNMANDVQHACTCGGKVKVNSTDNVNPVEISEGVVPVAPTVVNSLDDLLKYAGPELKAQLTGLVNNQQKEKDNLITSLLKVQKEFSKEDLDQMDINIVRRLAKVSGVVTVEGNNTNYDFSSSRSVVDPNASKRTQSIALPDPWNLEKKTQ